MSAHLPSAAAVSKRSDRRWPIWTSVIVGTFVLVCFLIGLIILPSREQAGFDPFAAICRAIGIPGYGEATSTESAARSPVSDVVWTVKTRRLLAQARAEGGAAIARNICAACHGENGISLDMQQFPNLAGQSDAAIFKELRDFQTGARKSDIMGPVAQSLTQQQLMDAGAYFSTRAASHVLIDDTGVSLDIIHLARQGDPARAIASCDSCHGASRSGPDGAPALLGQPSWYLETQLKNFASGARHNDMFERMRTIARQLTQKDIEGLAVYYGGRPPPR